MTNIGEMNWQYIEAKLGSSEADIRLGRLEESTKTNQVNIKESEAEVPRVSNFYLSSIKKSAEKSGESVDQFVTKNISTLSLLILSTENKGFSNEICSGNVDANDVRERRGVARFSGASLPREKELGEYGKGYVSLNQLHEKVKVIGQMSPADACRDGSISWDAICDFSTLSKSELTSYLKKAILSAPDILPTPTSKAPEDE